MNGFQDWSWATHNLKDTSAVRSGSNYDISVVINNWEALYLEGNFQATYDQFKTLHFWINGGANGSEPVAVKIISGGNPIGAALDVATIIGGPLPKNTWKEVNIPFTMFGQIPGNTILSALWWEANTADNAGTIYLDDIYVVIGQVPPPPPPSAQTVVVNTKADVHTFSKYVFGVNWASLAQLQANFYPINRWGGNAVTRYSWDLDTNNHASDWYFENIPNTVDVTKLPYGTSSDAFIKDTTSGNARVLLTVPLIGVTPKDRNKTCGFSVAKYGAQQSVDPYDTDCGNGENSQGKPITGNDYHDTSKDYDPSYVTNWLDHIEAAFGSNITTAVDINLDNEPGLWSSTHRDVHPAGLTYDELWNKTQWIAAPIRARKTPYITYGPVFWGWCAYMYSPADGCSDGPDRQAHGDLPFLEWYTKQVGDYRTKNNVELVNVIDVHFYPQASGVTGNQEDATTAGLRLRSVRGLWDPTYVDESWIAQPIYIIRRMQGYISAHAPGLKTAISEYEFGDDSLVTSALANAEALAVFAREGVTTATRWGAPAAGSFVENAFRIFLNYDGKGANVLGTSSVNATTTDIDTVGGYAFNDATGRVLYTYLFFKSQAAGNVTVDITSATTAAATGTLYRFEKNKPVYSAGPVTFSSGKATLELPGWSATLVRVPY
jgi:hypothetical protein